MRRGLRVLTGIVVAGALVSIGACVVGAWAVAPKVLGAGPEGIDLRPTPGATDPEEGLPPEVAGYVRGECRTVATFLGLDLGALASEATYEGPNGSVRAVAVRAASYHDAAALVAGIVERLNKVGALDSHRLLAEKPYEGWWHAAGKRNFVFWHASGREMDRHGFMWQSGAWCFAVASNDPVAWREVTHAFPY